MAYPVRPATGPADLASVRTLFGDYLAALPVDLAHQGVEAELAGLPGRYAAPEGILLLASRNGAPAGCVGVRPLAISGACEIKRLYVRDSARGTGTGRALIEAAIAFARAAGYERVLLDTLPTMAGAIALYRRLGFAPVPPYWESPIPGTLYFARPLRAP